MADGKIAYASAANLTITLASLADGSARESTAVVNTSNKYVDYLLMVKIKLAAGVPSGDKRVRVYAYGSLNGTDYTDNATGSDAAVTLRNPTNLPEVGTIQTPDSGALTYIGLWGSLAHIFGGIIPQQWGVVVVNETGVAFDSSGNQVTQTGVYSTIT